MTEKTTREDLVNALRSLAKAEPELVRDVFEDYHRVPSRAEYQTGPSEAASGAGLPRMIREYAKEQPQVALAEAYDRIGKYFSAEVEKALTSKLEPVYQGLAIAIKASYFGGETVDTLRAKIEDARIKAAVLKSTKGSKKEIAKAEKKARQYSNMLKSLELSNDLTSLLKAESEGRFKREEDKEEEGDQKDFADKAKDEEEEEKARKAKEEEEEEEEEEKKARKAKKEEEKANPNHDPSGRFSEKEGGEKKEEEDEGKSKHKSNASVTPDELLKVKAQLDSLSEIVTKISSGVPPTNFKGFTESEYDTLQKKLKGALDSKNVPIDAMDRVAQIIDVLESVKTGKMNKGVLTKLVESSPPSVKILLN